ncbi:MAG: phospho-N-acetylmuramoyl-pentapeptide-transferase [Firmicutes bacterium]|uniref:phospho-N-acetylmuramoyl-pentapeptide- transferase n=1 Tax=Ruminococcus bromii TaxID=40518 RepID=UPI0024289713|nr:phospho-N-acetylmuramoyl-pentapeptide-transferase [Ruminococcus bromii]MCI7625182.1 phospho-N-acetylmuramoyl-pentapeptide-transferase [Bacillota bacterium]MDY4107643.1 phospho-N-acetylmuramoyl-pentapeptide-transferase [Oscillospiraceae bacterium]MDD7399591.1 phospho-N-acetylmuramoyl-pentapeptide-transferase [Bacillota bacterium]MDD7634684.1 phospho-N-acetylmuramoyl-pentapeptide-transferase [Bacillota bacterium]MDE8726190.1 phospho-N-acetylmuramoyl-pentapeptide-transferase [Ruminococcus brom
MDIVLYCLAIVIAAVITGLLGYFMVPFLHKIKFGQTIREVGPSWHKNKQGTPTMGGIMFIIGSSVAAVICIAFLWLNGGAETQLMLVKVMAGALMAVGFGIVGFLDDYISIKKHRNLGLTEIQKLILQFIIVGAYLLSVALAGGTTETVIPFLGSVDLGFFYYILAAVFIVGMVNAVNFTDGIDGLNTSVTLVVALVFSVIAMLLNRVGLSLYAAAIVGAMIGFLFWNANPAKVFMGDTGSLFLGGAVCALAFGVDMPILLILIGIIYIVEILSVVLQVTYFKISHGKRIFKMAPIHHHFEMCGWNENKICFVFSGVTLLAGIIGVLLAVFGC